MPLKRIVNAIPEHMGVRNKPKPTPSVPL